MTPRETAGRPDRPAAAPGPDAPFLGPLFLVGLSRSGTKLLRSILNRHPDVGIPVTETHFVPYLLHRFPASRFPLDHRARRELRRVIADSIFYFELQQRLPDFEPLDFDELSGLPRIQDVIRAVLVRYGGVRGSEPRIWGDKTPQNLPHIRRLIQAYPTARFVHLVRDPRDRALSVRDAWGGSLVLSAERWRRQVGAARAAARSLPDAVLQLRYEDLLDDPESESRRLCGFLDIAYTPDMLALERPIETHGPERRKTRSAAAIVRNNAGRHRTELSARQIRRMDAIVHPLASELGYPPVEPVARPAPLRGLPFAAHRAHDAVRSVLYHVRRWGPRRGLDHLRWRARVRVSPEHAQP